MNLFKTKKEDNIYAVLTRFFLLASIFIVPIFFLPFNAQILELNKAAVFYILTLLAAVFWFVDLSVNKEKKIKRPPLFTPLIIFGLVYLIASLFSYQLDYSLIGTINYYHHSLLSVIFFMVFFFLIVNSFSKKEAINRAVLVFVFSSAVASLIFGLKIFKLYLFPWEFAKLSYFNLTANSSSGFAVYLALAALICFILLMKEQEKWKKIFFTALISLNLAILFLIDLNAGWYALITGFAALLFFLTAKSRQISLKWSFLPALIIALSILMIFISAAGIYDIGVTNDISLDQATSLKVAKDSLAKNPLFGSGPGTFYFDFSRFRPLDFNNTDLWNLSFIKSGSEWWQILSTLGGLGFIAYLGLAILFFISLIKKLFRQKSGETDGNLILFLASFFLIFFAGAYYAFSFSLMFIFFLFLSLGAAWLGIFSEKKEEKFSEKYKSPFSSLGLSLVVIFAIIIVYFTGRAWLADYYINKATQAVEKQEDLTAVEEYLIKAVDNFSWQESYNFSLAQNYVVRAQLEAQEAQPDAAKIQEWITKAIIYTDKTVQLAEKDPVVYSSVAGLYQEISLLAQDDISEPIIESYKKAIELDKNNPQHYYNLAGYYSVYAQSIINVQEQISDDQKEAAASAAEEAIAEALAYYDKAIALKTNYAQAEAAKALTYELKEEIDTAINELILLVKKYPLDFSLFYELGRIYLNENSLDLAESAFKQVASLFPGHSNAHWQLSVIYEKQGKKDLAIAEMEKVLELNPENEQVEARLSELTNLDSEE